MQALLRSNIATRLLLALFLTAGVLLTPAQPNQPLSATPAFASAPSSVARYGVWEYTGLTYPITSPTNLTNPQDQVTITATFNCSACTPSAVTNQAWPGFYDLTNSGNNGNFRVRYTPQMVGSYLYSITLSGPNGTVGPITGSFTSTASTNKGFIRKQAGNASRLVTETSGTATSPDVPQMFAAVGVNQTATGSPVGSGTLQSTYTELGHLTSNAQTDSTLVNGGMSLLRMSLNNASPNPVPGVSVSGNTYSLAQSVDADTAFADAKNAGYHIWTTFFLSGIPYPNMETDSGGSPSTAEETAVENAMRYVMARYGAYTDIWELANEASAPDAWITKLTSYLHTQDPYTRLVTNSNPNTNDIADGLDLRSPHVNLTSYDAYQAMTNFGNSLTNPVVYGEVYAKAGASANLNWDLTTPATIRLEAWSGMVTGLGFIYWMDNAQQGYINPNTYVGPEERNYIRSLQNIAQTLDPAGTASNPANGVYALSSTHTLLVYFNGNRVSGGGTANFGTLKTISASVNIQVSCGGTCTGYWIEPSSGRLIQTQTISSTGTQTLTTPAPGFYEDIAFVMYGTGWGASGTCAPLPCAFASASLPSGLSAPPVAMPRVSRGLTAYSATGFPANAVDADYSTVWGGSTSGSLAVDISSLSSSLSRIYFAVFDDVGSETPSYDHTLEGLPSAATNNIGAFTWNINTAPGGSLPGSGWQTRTVHTSNTYNGRAFTIKNGGNNWLQLAVTAGDGSPSSVADINLDIHDGSNSNDDMWLLLGDQLVQDGLRHQVISGTTDLSDLITASRPPYTPLMIDGGIGGMTSSIAAEHINRFLGLNYGKFVVLQFGTDDAINSVLAATYYSNLEYMVKAVLMAGKIPVVSTPAWASDATTQALLSQYNTQVLNLYSNYPQVVKGPDLWNNHLALGADNIHPTSAGYATMRTLYASALINNVYNFGIGTSASAWPQLAADPERDSRSTASVTASQLSSMYWQKAFSPEILSPQAEPIINNNLLYIGTEYSHLYAYTLAGTLSWTFNTAGPIEQTAAATTSAVYVADMTGALYAVNPTTGTQLWKRQLTTRLGCNTAVLMDDDVAPTHIIVGCRDGNLYAVDPNVAGCPSACVSPGTILWTYTAGAPLLSSPASHGGTVFVVSNDLFLHAVNASTGALVWKSAKLGGVGMTAYYPVIVPEPGTATYRVVVRTWPVTSFNITGEPMYPADFTSASQSSLLTTIHTTPTNYRPDLVVFANDGTATQQPLGLQCIDCQSMHSPSFPGCLDAYGYLVVTARGQPQSGQASGWADYNIASGQFVSYMSDGPSHLDSGTSSGSNSASTLNDTTKNWPVNQFVGERLMILTGTGSVAEQTIRSNTATQLVVAGSFNPVPDATSTYSIGYTDGFGNRDENLTASCTANGVFGTHVMEGNANYTGYLDLSAGLWKDLTLSLNIQNVGIATEGNGANPMAIAAGIAAHNALGLLTVRKTQ